MSESFSGTSAQIAIVVVGGDLGTLSGVNLAAGESTNLAVDAQDDLAVRPDVTWVGSTAVRLLVFSGHAASTFSVGAA